MAYDFLRVQPKTDTRQMLVVAQAENQWGAGSVVS